MLLNQLMTSLVFFHWLTLVAILPSSFFSGFNRQDFGLLKKFGLCSFKMMKQPFLPLTNILFNVILFSIIFLPSTLIVSFILSETFLYVAVTASVVIFCIHLYLICKCWKSFSENTKTLIVWLPFYLCLTVSESCFLFFEILFYLQDSINFFQMIPFPWFFGGQFNVFKP